MFTKKFIKRFLYSQSYVGVHTHTISVLTDYAGCDSVAASCGWVAALCRVVFMGVKRPTLRIGVLQAGVSVAKM